MERLVQEKKKALLVAFEDNEKEIKAAKTVNEITFAYYKRDLIRDRLALLDELLEAHNGKSYTQTL